MLPPLRGRVRGWGSTSVAREDVTEDGGGDRSVSRRKPLDALSTAMGSGEVVMTATEASLEGDLAGFRIDVTHHEVEGA